MHPLNIMWLLHDINNNSEVLVEFERSKHVDSISISTSDFHFNISECGSCSLIYKNGDKKIDKSREHWRMVRGWVKAYVAEVL